MKIRQNVFSLLLLAMLIGGCISYATPNQSCQIAFRSRQMISADDVETSEDIYIMDCDGANRVQLTSHPGDEYSPEWSPDGKKIAYRSKREGNWEIYIINVDGGGERNFSNHFANDLDPAWSPDGKWIAFASDRDGGDLDIYIQEVEGGRIIQITANNYPESGPSWSPDGDVLAFAQNRYDDELFGKLVIVSLEDFVTETVLSEIVFIREPTWSPDGKQLAFVLGYEISTICVVDTQDWKYIDLIKLEDRPEGGEMRNYSPSWSPDSNQIVFGSNINNGIGIYIMNRDGSELRRITNSDWENWIDRSPDWRP